MAHRLPDSYPDPTPKRKAKKEPDYLAFIRTLPCIVTRRQESWIQAAHLSYADRSYGHYGRGRGTKAPDRWALPLSEEQHRIQHGMNERTFWETAGINPHVACLVIWGLWSDAHEEVHDEVVQLILRNGFKR